MTRLLKYLKYFFLSLKNSGIKNTFSKVLNRFIKSSYNYRELSHFDPNYDAFEYKPVISAIVYINNENIKDLKATVNSISEQNYENINYIFKFEDKPSDSFCSVLKQQLKNFSIISYQLIPVTNEIPFNSLGEYFFKIYSGDSLTTDAFYELIRILNIDKYSLVYTDEDCYKSNRKYIAPIYKPDFSPHTLLTNNYFGNLCFFNTQFIIDNKLDVLNEYEAYINIFYQPEKIAHVRKVLYHKQKNRDINVMPIFNNYKRALTQLPVNDNYTKELKIFDTPLRFQRILLKEPLVSIIIPFKDKVDLLNKCINSVINKSTYQNYEIICINNNSIEDKTLKEIEFIKEKDSRITFCDYNHEFNFSRINNYAVENFVKGDYLIQLNNDIEIISKDWIERLLDYAMFDNAGAVGGKLYYPNSTIQHVGMTFDIEGATWHIYRGCKDKSTEYLKSLNLPRNVSFVTAACLMVATSKYKEIGGYDNKLPIAFNDVDFNIRLLKAGYFNIFTPFCEAYHDESYTRKNKYSGRRPADLDYNYKKHKQFFNNGDPYFGEEIRTYLLNDGQLY